MYIIYRYVYVSIVEETEKGKKLAESHTDKTVKENSELLDQRQASNQGKDPFLT